MILDTKLTCPKCGGESSFKTFQIIEEIMEILRLAARFGKNWPWTEEYLNCFKSVLDKPLKPARMKIILEELLRFIDPSTGSGCGFNYNGKFYAIRANAIYEAIRYVAQTNKTGFKNHNYMKKVAIDFNQKMIAQDEREQKIREEEAMNRTRRDPGTPQRIKELIKGIGG
jgi:hypothetical protein